MIVFPNCKINLGLHIARKRDDRFHDIQTVFYPLQLRDALEIIPNNSSQEPANRTGRLTVSGLPIEGETNNNLCIKAYELLKRDFPQLPGINIYLHKAIPMAAGLGGGSSDGAFMLKLLNEKFTLNLSVEKMLDYSLELGSDCPFFIINKPCYATGRGEMLETIPLNLSNYSWMLVQPGIQINTAWAFGQVTPSTPQRSLREIVLQPAETWKGLLTNDFESPVFKHYPALKEIKEELYASGAIYASMTGSGSCIYGIFPKGKAPHNLFPAYKCYFPITTH
jgi:4-diphosphocytidyl-2-C-methyl-D-erythritol kinase